MQILDSFRCKAAAEGIEREQNCGREQIVQKNEMFLEASSLNYDVFTSDFRCVNAGKAIIFGIPKCGNTWLQSLLSSYFSVEPVLTLGEVDKSGVLSIHDPYEEYMLGRPDFAQGVCLVRDIRDVIVSYYHYGKTGQFRGAMSRFYYEDLDSFYYEWFLSRCVPSHRIHTFADEYAERGVPVVRYERLCCDTEGELARIIRRWGGEVDSERLRSIVEKHSLGELKKRGLTLREGHHIQTSHFRKGGWGGFVEEMPLHILNDVNQRFHDYLARWGYPTDVSPEALESYRSQLLCSNNSWSDS